MHIGYYFKRDWVGLVLWGVGIICCGGSGITGFAVLSPLLLQTHIPPSPAEFTIHLSFLEFCLFGSPNAPKTRLSFLPFNKNQMISFDKIATDTTGS
jgi:hypothetical protein